MKLKMTDTFENGSIRITVIDESDLAQFLLESSESPGVTVTYEPHFCLNLSEIGTLDCGYCCKIVKCDTCGKEYDSHRKIYGCPKGI